MKNAFILSFVLLFAIQHPNSVSAEMVTFEGLLPSANSFFNGGPTTNSDGFTIDGVKFPNDYSAAFSSWEGWSYSNVVNTTFQSYLNQYAAWPGSGSSGSSSYGVAYVFGPTYVSFASPVTVSSADFANTTYAALTILNGDTFGATKFGGESGNAPDYFLLNIEGHSGVDGLGSSTGSIDFYLADYRNANNALDFVRSGWANVGLSTLGTVQSLRFSLTTTDVGMFGPNTPTYFAIDNLSFSTVPEPNSLTLLGSAVLVLLSNRRSTRRNVRQAFQPDSLCG